MNSSTSSSEPGGAPWRRYWRTALGVALGLLGAIYALIVVVDPYDTLWLSPPFERAPMASNQRFSYPALARRAAFDSAVIGTSTVRLWNPARLNDRFGGRFVNLSMNSATAFEQSRILDVFARSHRKIGTVIIGIDVVWCQAGAPYERLTFRPFPPWLYDDDPWNDFLHLLDLKTLEITGRQIAYLTGLREPKFGLDGYANFLPPKRDYDLARARENIYGTADRSPATPAEAVQSDDPGLAAKLAGLRFPDHGMLADMLAALPAETRKILVFVPYHAANQGDAGSQTALHYEGCKRRLARLAAAVPNGHALDFMIPSPITTEDTNYWDSLHTTTEIADRVVDLIAAAVLDGLHAPDLFRRLHEEPHVE